MTGQLLKPLQHLQRGLQFHAVVGGVGRMATEFLNTAVFETQQRAPTSRTWVAAAGTIRRCSHDPSPSFRH
jgi:hypothetical protein